MLQPQRFITTFIATSLLSAFAPAAFAEDGLPPDTDPTPREKAQDADAAIDRGFITTHAETIGEGKWAINAYELVFIGVTYGFTEDIQASLSTLLPVVEDIPLVLVLQPKFVLARTDQTIVSLRTPLTYLQDFSGSEDTILGSFGAGILVDHYFDREGRYAVHGGFLVSGIFGDGFDATDGLDVAEGAFFELDVGFSLGVADILKIIIEWQAFAAAGDGGFDVAEATLLTYGVRFHSGSIAGDLGFVRPIGVDTEGLLLGVPYLAFSARF